MKYTAIALLLATFAFGQVTTNTNDITLVKEIPIKKHIGKKFRARMDIRNLPADQGSSANFFTLQVGKSDWDFIEHSGENAIASDKDTDWHTYTLSGEIKEGAQKIWLYIHASGNGEFYFDTLALEIEDGNNGWVSVPVPNGDFEASDKPLKGLKHGELKEKDKISIVLSKSDAAHGQSLHITSTGSRAYTRIVYGNNPAAGKYVDSHGTKIYYETYGEGEPLLLLHGNGGSITSFSAQLPEFAKHYKVIAVDTRGQGKSADLMTGHFSYDLFADDMKALLDSLKLKQVNVVGWSDGGNTGLLLAMKYPEYVKRLVTMGANLNASEASVSKKVLSQTEKEIAKLKSKNDPKDKVIIRLMEMLLHEPNIAPGDLTKIKAEVLVLAGEKDVILEEHTRLIAGSIPNAKVTILKGETHMVPEENPELFNKTVLGFLGE